MNEILQQRIEEAAKKISHNKMAFWEDCDYSTKDIEEIIYDACKLTAVNVLQNQWISVEEALPTERDKEDKQYSTNVFARTKDCIRYAYYDFYNESWCSVEGGYRFGGDVTHWMPIPSLEEEEK